MTLRLLAIRAVVNVKDTECSPKQMCVHGRQVEAGARVSHVSCGAMESSSYK